jgi:DNA-binding beta-propeller fold protein YncE
MKRTAIFLAIVILILNTSTAYAKEYDYIVEDGNRVPIPLTYMVKDVITLAGEPKGLALPEDLFVDKNNMLYVADTGNNRIIKMDNEGNVLGYYTGPEERPFKGPKGVYADDYGHIYVADTGNQRIVHLASDGKYIEEFVRPDSELLDQHFTFEPSKIYVSPTGYIYTMKGQQLMMLDAQNGFRGFIGAAEVGYDFTSVLIRMFASEEQKKKVARRMPPPYINFTVGPDEMIYAVTMDYSNGQVKKLNAVGQNILEKQPFGEQTDDQGQHIQPIFSDITIDQNGIITVAEERTCKIYQYDQEGHLLTVFGGKGTRKGLFQKPSAVDTDSSGNVYVLDMNANNIQVFEPTRFISLVHSAVKLYSEGKYEEALRDWQQVLKIDENYRLANKGMAKVLMKAEEWKEAMTEYKKANDRDGYTNAFTEHRHQMFRRYFGLVVLAFIILAILVFYGTMGYKKLAEKILDHNRYREGGF